MNLIPRQMLNDPACANNQNLIQLVKGVIYEANKQQRLNEQMHNAYKHQVFCSFFSFHSTVIIELPDEWNGQIAQRAESSQATRTGTIAF